MKAEEVQRYDWTQHENFASKVNYRQVLCMNDGYQIHQGQYQYFDGQYGWLTSPVPITHDILAKNGWELKNGVMVFKNDVIRLGWKENGTLIFGYYEWPIKVTAVHQLQHILRDVGLVEYANSMRV